MCVVEYIRAHPIVYNANHFKEEDDDDDDDGTDSAPSNGPPSVGEDIGEGENSTQDLDASMEDLDDNDDEEEEDEDEGEELESSET
ncbi:hypothetical protein R3P38DRAFT_2836885 [Favolaschia claudopus]|uniref:Uncharacterized protein n=1 Tax=Favolaschia claudopus TaxID=2862362 RepID=A0AAW0E8C1_9AGAR